MTEIYLHIVARMADYMDTHPYGPPRRLSSPVGCRRRCRSRSSRTGRSQKPRCSLPRQTRKATKTHASRLCVSHESNRRTSKYMANRSQSVRMFLQKYGAHHGAAEIVRQTKGLRCHIGPRQSFQNIESATVPPARNSLTPMVCNASAIGFSTGRPLKRPHSPGCTGACGINRPF